MKLLLDTHLLLWAASTPERLPAAARAMIEDSRNQPLFTAQAYGRQPTPDCFAAGLLRLVMMTSPSVASRPARSCPEPKIRENISVIARK